MKVVSNNIICVNGIKVPIGSHAGKTIIIGSDHRGFDYKAEIKRALKTKDYNKGYKIIDVGTFSSERCDYPYISYEIGRRVSEDAYSTVGIGICGSGIGILIPASKHKHVYVARCLSPSEAETSRKHNNTNVLGIGADCISLEMALATITAWLETPFYSEPSKEQNYLDRFVQTVVLERGLQGYKKH